MWVLIIIINMIIVIIVVIITSITFRYSPYLIITIIDYKYHMLHSLFFFSSGYYVILYSTIFLFKLFKKVNYQAFLVYIFVCIIRSLQSG